ncbi:MAG: Uma2 family endonuclease [Cyclobacteriaceae bacterium]|nr:Uma2 family endonuclease [Cyclobacteriaceae bacterium]
MDVYKMLPEGTLAELIDGILYMSSSPIDAHQRVVTRLLGQIHFFVDQHDLGEVFTAPFDVYLDEHSNAVQPDILFIEKENLAIVKGHVHGVPDLIIEILSEGNSEHDMVRKRNLYEKSGVKEYWIIHPTTRIVTGYQLRGESFKELETTSGQINSQLLKHTFIF